MAQSDREGDWLLLEELYERLDPSFVDELRKFDNADRLGGFAAKWIADRRPEARRFLFDYLSRPLNAFRHEALVKRLFKQAEAANDDELMSRFLVAFDRSIRLRRRNKIRYEGEQMPTVAEANTLAETWRQLGFKGVKVGKNWKGKPFVSGHYLEPKLVTPQDSVMPRGEMRTAYDVNSWNPVTRVYRTFPVPDWVYLFGLNPMDYQEGVTAIPDDRRKLLEKRRLFTVTTRRYLQRRAWRYFRKLGRTHPDRYVDALKPALIEYDDADTADGPALLDNWGLCQALFRFSPCLKFDKGGCRVAGGRTLASLEPAPRYVKLWNMQPRAYVDLLTLAKSRAVRIWSVQMVRRNLGAIAPLFTIDERLHLLADGDPEVVRLANDLLRDDPTLKDLPTERWLALLETASPSALDLVAELVGRWVVPERVPPAERLRLAMVRPLPIARLGFRWLQAAPPASETEWPLLLKLAEAESETLRPEMVRWASAFLVSRNGYHADWLLQWLDARHQDVRTEAWAWFEQTPQALEDVDLWQKLMESPYDDIKMKIVEMLQKREQAFAANAKSLAWDKRNLDPDRLLTLWGAVLLNVHRGHRAKPLVVRQLLSRLEARPDEASRLLPLLGVALRSIRGPEWRSGLVALVRLANVQPSSAPLIRQAFPELVLG